MTALPPAGWFPDPEAGGTRWRWWDGAQWAPPGYGYTVAYDPVGHARELAARAESTRRVGQWFRWAMVAFSVGLLGAGIAFGFGMRDIWHSVDTPATSDEFPSSIAALDILTIPFGAAIWAYTGLFIAWLYQAGRFADLQPWPAMRARTLGAFSVLIPIVNFWWPYEAIRDCCAPGERPSAALRWFVLQLAAPMVSVWSVAACIAFAPAAVAAVVVVIAGSVLAAIAVLGRRLVADVEAMQRAHLPAPT